MDINSVLPISEPHPTKSIFDGFSRGRISAALGISITHLRNCLAGYSRPSESLNTRMHELAARLEAVSESEKAA